MAKAINGHSNPKECYGHGHSGQSCGAATRPMLMDATPMNVFSPDFSDM